LDWTVKFDARAFLELQKLDRTAQTRIASFLKQRIAGGSDPRKPGKALVGEMRGLWRYRIGDYRAVCSISDEFHTVRVLRIAHRKDVYR
jgi:mRNA interferase RelE/StbE